MVLGLDELLFILLDGILENNDRFLQLINLGLVRLDRSGVIVDDSKFCNLSFQLGDFLLAIFDCFLIMKVLKVISLFEGSDLINKLRFLLFELLYFTPQRTKLC